VAGTKAERMPVTTLVPAGTWTSEQLEVVRRSVAPGCTDEELAFFAQVCRHKNLDPFAGEIVAIPRWDSRAGRNVLVIQETVAGLRALAERSGLYNGQDPPLWCGPDARWVEVWLDDKTPPAAAKVAVYRKGWDRPTVGIARWSSYVQLDKNGKPAGLWKTGSDFMLWKCAEAAALKRAFKHALADAGISTRELSDASRISMEARAAGLDDDARHALVAEITDGRTDSTRDLTDHEALEVRAELARITAEVNADPVTGEINKPALATPPTTTTSSGGVSPSCGAGQHGACPGYYKTAYTCGCACHKPDAVARTIARAAGDLEARLERLTTWQIEELKTWRRAYGLARPIGTLDPTERTRLTTELDRRGWGIDGDPPPPPPDTPPAPEPGEPDPYDEPF
jgi:phage recombination protein Bet